MPEQQSEPNDDDGLVPPLKVLRKRLNGVYRAEGFTGPTRRYVLIVAMLVGLASLPTLAAITAGSKEIDDGTSGGALDAPFLPVPSTGAVTPVRPEPSSSAAAPNSPGSPANDPDGIRGQAGERRTMPRPSSNAVIPPSHDPRYGASSGSPRIGGSRADGKPSGPGPDGPSGPGDGLPPRHPVRPSHSGPPNRPTRPTDPEDMPSPPGRQFCHELGECGSRKHRHQRPDWSRRRHGDDDKISIHIVPTGHHARHSTVREDQSGQPFISDHTSNRERRHSRHSDGDGDTSRPSNSEADDSPASDSESTSGSKCVDSPDSDDNRPDSSGSGGSEDESDESGPDFAKQHRSKHHRIQQ